MESDLTFESIAAAGRAIVDAHKKKRGFEDGIRRLLSELYPDNAHFIYELLQNAEDAQASFVEFEFHPGALEVRHNGSRMFSLEDIDSIANIGDSNKKDDETQIGKFGVGFKAVYSYTTRPEIRSGQYSFAIRDLFVPERIDGTAPTGLTTFTFPFDRADKLPDAARSEVERGLRELDEKTLLFLNNIREITYALPDGDIGYVKRTDVDDLTIHIEATQDQQIVESTWLRLVGLASTTHGVQSPLTVAAAFKLEPKQAGRRRASIKPGTPPDAPLGIVPLPAGDVSIYFPAVKETSGLKFHIHAPFASTVARDSVRDTPENTQLVADIAHVVVSHLESFRDRGLIDEGLLAALPNHEDDLPPMYEQVRSAILDAFNERELTPVHGGGGFGAAQELISSPVEIRRGLRQPDLKVLAGLAGLEADFDPRWIAAREGRAGKFLEGLDPSDFGWSELEQVFRALRDTQVFGWGPRTGDGDDASGLSTWVEWLASKSDSEILNLYVLIGTGRATHSLSQWLPLDSIPLIRIKRRGKIHHVRGRDAFLPASRRDTGQSRVPVDLAYFEDDDDERANYLRAFYKAAGVKRWNERAKLEDRLRVYQSDTRPVPETEKEMAQHLADIRIFVQFAASNKAEARELFEGVPFLLSAHPEGSLFWVRPEDTYLDLPFEETGLAALYPWRVEYEDEDEEVVQWWDEPEKYVPAGLYLDVEGIEGFLTAVGSSCGITFAHASVFRNPQLRREWWVNNRHSRYTVELDWAIRELPQIIATGNPTLLRTMWETVINAKSSMARAVYQANRSANRHVFESQLLQQLRSMAWVLDREGTLRRPNEITIDELPEAWPHPSADSLAHHLDLGADAAREEQQEAAKPHYAKMLGITPEDAELIKQLRAVGVDPEMALRDLIAQKRSQETFPEAASADPDRRSAVAAHDAEAAATHLTEIRPRRVTVGQGSQSVATRSYLREQYTNTDGDMYCQACQTIMPFKVKNNWYFEAIDFIGNRNRVHAQNALALCPLCAAKYTYKLETSYEVILESLSSLTINADEGTVEIPVLLNGKVVHLRLTGKHALDLQAAMRVAGEERNNSSSEKN